MTRLPYYDLSPDALNALRSIKSVSGTGWEWVAYFADQWLLA